MHTGHDLVPGLPVKSGVGRRRADPGQFVARDCGWLAVKSGVGHYRAYPGQLGAQVVIVSRVSPLQPVSELVSRFGTVSRFKVGYWFQVWLCTGFKAWYMLQGSVLVSTSKV